MDPTFTVVTDEGRLALERLARRLTMDRRFLPEDPDAGLDLRRFATARITGALLSKLKSGIEGEALKDEAISRARVAVKQNDATQTLTIAIGVTTRTGTRSLELEVSDLTVSILNLNQDT